MSIEEHKEVVRRLWEAADKGDMDGVVEPLTPDFSFQLTSNPPMDREGYKQFGGVFYAAFPDHQHTIEDQVAQDDKVVTLVTIRGTHQGEFSGIAPTGKSVTIVGLVYDRFEGGKIAERRAMLDVMGLMQQLGAIPE